MMVIYASPTDEERKPDIALLSLIDVGNCASQGQLYTFVEYRGLLQAAGFCGVSQPAIVLMSAWK